MPSLSAQTRQSGRLVVRPGPAARPVLERVVGAAASRADLPLDRAGEAQLAAGLALDAAWGEAAEGAVQIDFRADAMDGLHLRIGPLVAGGAERVVVAPTAGLGAVVARLAESWSPAHDDDGREWLDIALG